MTFVMPVSSPLVFPTALEIRRTAMVIGVVASMLQSFNQYHRYVHEGETSPPNQVSSLVISLSTSIQRSKATSVVVNAGAKLGPVVSRCGCEREE